MYNLPVFRYAVDSCSVQVAIALGKEGIFKSMRATFSKGLGSAMVLEPVLLFRNLFSIKTRKGFNNLQNKVRGHNIRVSQR
jgi:hypothetical protein